MFLITSFRSDSTWCAKCRSRYETGQRWSNMNQLHCLFLPSDVFIKIFFMSFLAVIQGSLWAGRLTLFLLEKSNSCPQKNGWCHDRFIIYLRFLFLVAYCGTNRFPLWWVWFSGYDSSVSLVPLNYNIAKLSLKPVGKKRKPIVSIKKSLQCCTLLSMKKCSDEWMN